MKIEYIKLSSDIVSGIGNDNKFLDLKLLLNIVKSLRLLLPVSGIILVGWKTIQQRLKVSKMFYNQSVYNFLFNKAIVKAPAIKIS